MRNLVLLPLTMSLLVTACAAPREMGATRAACLDPQEIPAAPASLDGRLSGKPEDDVRMLGTNLEQWKAYGQALTTLLDRTCQRAGGQGTSKPACARQAELSKTPPPVREHLSNQTVEDAMLLAVAIRDWQAHTKALRAALKTCG